MIGNLVYRGRNTVAGLRRQVECETGDSGLVVRVGEFRFGVSPESGQVRLLAGGPAIPDAAISSPATVLSFALRGTFCLHASAVLTPGGVIAFLGKSGKGKSTLAAHLSAFLPGPWELISDDILPVEFLRDPPSARRGSLDAAPEGGGELLPLGAVYVLRNWRRDAVSLTDLSRSEAFVTLARHSVATRLFDPPLKTAHFEACVAASSRIPVRNLTYPRRLSALDDVRHELEATHVPISPSS